MAEFGEVNGGDVALNVIYKLGLGGLFATEVIITVPSPCAAHRGIMLFGLGLPNSVWGDPFDRVGRAWKTLAENLKSERKTLKALIDDVGEDTDLWTGPGAEQFKAYAENNLIAGIEKLVSVSELMSDRIGKLAEGAYLNAIKALVGTCAVLILQAVAQSLQAIPVVGQILFQIVTVTGWIFELSLWADLIMSLVDDSNAALDFHNQLSTALDGLRAHFGQEGDALLTTADGIRAQQPGAIADPGTWSKGS